MIRFILICLLLNAGLTIAQSSSTKYYNNQWLEKEVKPEKAKYSLTTINNADGSITKETRHLKNNEIVRSESFKGNEPVGVWIYERGDGTAKLDYDFPLKYTNEKCRDTLPVKIINCFSDNDSLGYKAPQFQGGGTIFKYIMHEVVYPQRPKEEGIQGKIYVDFTLTKDGTIENVTVRKGVTIELDKEAVRVFRGMKFDTPPMFNGRPVTFCTQMPLSFRLQ